MPNLFELRCNIEFQKYLWQEIKNSGKFYSEYFFLVFTFKIHFYLQIQIKIVILVLTYFFHNKHLRLHHLVMLFQKML